MSIVPELPTSRLRRSRKWHCQWDHFKRVPAKPYQRPVVNLYETFLPYVQHVFLVHTTAISRDLCTDACRRRTSYEGQLRYW